jgi:hypothetical protein
MEIDQVRIAEVLAGLKEQIAMLEKAVAALESKSLPPEALAEALNALDVGDLEYIQALLADYD